MPKLAPAALVERDLCLLLPSFKDGPQHSPHLLRADEDDVAAGRPDRSPPGSFPRSASVRRTALEVLLALPRDDGPGIAVGDSARFLAEAAKLALELLARGRVLPTLARRDDRWLARWEPVTIDPSDDERVRLLAESMPPLLRAEIGSSEHGRPPEVVVADVLGALVDACARRFLSGRFSGRGRRRSPSAVEAWLAATDRRRTRSCEADELELAALAEQLEEWRQAMERYAAHRTFRTCFRLSAPEDPAEPPADGPATDANGARQRRNRGVSRSCCRPRTTRACSSRPQEVWSSNGDGLRVLGRRLEDPQERLLGGLGHALRLWPELEPALQEPAPTGVELDADAAFRFLRDAVPALEQAGFGVLAPAWWSKRLRLKLKAEPFEEWEEGSGLFSLDGLCAYEWRIAVGDAIAVAGGAARAGGAEAAAGDVARAVDRAASRGRRGGADVLRGPRGAR